MSEQPSGRCVESAGTRQTFEYDDEPREPHATLMATLDSIDDAIYEALGPVADHDAKTERRALRRFLLARTFDTHLLNPRARA